jgi:hypothetical protein
MMTLHRLETVLYNRHLLHWGFIFFFILTSIFNIGTIYYKLMERIMQIIGVAGQIANGKDALANHLVGKLNANSGQSWGRRAFADGLKSIFYDTFEVTQEFTELWKRQNVAPEGFDMTVRQALQFIGDGFRKIKPSVWVDWTFKRAPQQVILSDVRYVSELKSIKGRGGINILIYRSGHMNEINHPSEAQIRPLVDFFDRMGMEGDVREIVIKQGPYIPTGADYIDLYVRNNGTIEDFYDKAEKIVIPYVKEYYA